MIIPDLFDEIYTHLVEYWREKIEKEDPMYGARENEVKEKLYEKLDDKTKELATHYGITVASRVEHIYYEICNRLFLFAIKAGMDMQKAFDETE